MAIIVFELAQQNNIESGGIEITLDAEKMGELINLKPDLVLEDCNQDNNVINSS